MTEKKNFTPGEWVISDNPSTWVWCNGMPIAGVHTIVREIKNGEPVFSDNEIKANLHLIKTAPKMYDKLETVLLLCAGNLLRKTRCDILGAEIEALLKEARGEA